ncbi:hypothetical protein B0H13DRAFT_2126503 [Mycena leptocephala]|nr:hypothetical protein B0H13DRAFT_2126503 [Mycena leptocephala]
MALSRRTLRSGEEFSAFDMYFDVADCLAKRIQEQEAACMIDEPVNEYHESNDPDPLPFWINPSPSSPLPPPPPPRLEGRNPGVKVFHLKHRDEALHAAIQVDVDIDALPHSEPAWIGKRNAQDDHTFEDGMGGHIYSEKEIRELTGVDGMRYINWLGMYVFLCPFPFHPGPHALTVPHLDFGNLSWGWCVITALRRFNPDLAAT